MTSTLVVFVFAVLTVGLIAWWSQSIRRMIIAFVASFLIAIAVYGLAFSITGVRLPYESIPFFMFISVVIMLWREAREIERKKQVAKESPVP